VTRPLVPELDFDTVVTLVAAHARTSVGRHLFSAIETIPSPETSRYLAGLTREVGQLLGASGPLGLTGIDEAAPWLEPGTLLPAEPTDLLSLLSLARRVASVRRQLLAAPQELQLLHDAARSLPDTSALVQRVASRLGRDGQIPDSASRELARLRRHTTRLRQHVMTELDALRRSHPAAVADAPPTIRRDRYCLPVRSAAQGPVAGLVLSSSGSGATLFVEPFSVVALNNDLADSTSREGEEVVRILGEVVTAFSAAACYLRS